MPIYCGIELHSDNHGVSVIDDDDKRILEKKLDNDPQQKPQILSQYQRRHKAVAWNQPTTGTGWLMRSWLPGSR